MSSAKDNDKSTAAVNFHFQRRMREGLFIVTVAVSIFILLALLTYHATDPSWSYTGTKHVAANLGGAVGAWLSDLLLYTFGFVAYIFPVLLAGAAWTPFKQLDEEMLARSMFVLRLVGFVLILSGASALASLYLPSHYFPNGSGGIFGEIFAGLLVRVFNFFGTGLIMAALLLAGVTLFTGLSWLRIADLLGRGIFYGIDNLGRLILSSFSKRDKDEEEPVARVKIEPKVIARDEPAPEKPLKKIYIQQKMPEGAVFEPALEGSKPSLALLDKPEQGVVGKYSREQLEAKSREVEIKLRDFGVDAQVVAVHPGPVVTRFELLLSAGTKVSKVTGLAKDLARSLSVVSVRVVEIIPGKSVIGLELPNDEREVVRLREILASKQYRNAHSPLSIALGKDIAGNPVVVDLAKMPHLLVAGTTGSGKSVGLNALLLSILYKYTSKEVKLILIDPKMLELSIYDGIPHLLAPVVTNMKEAANALRWCVIEMERRYKLMASLGVRNLIGYNNKVREAAKHGTPLLDPLWDREQGEEQSELVELPYIMVLADEYADMIMVVGKKIEELIARIAQKARAAGIHLVLATQRPSVDVITGLIKANIPSRVAFQVSAKVDSRVILDQGGAEQLLGNGDMLYLPPGTVVPVRVHGAFVADDEVHKVVNDLKRRGKPDYVADVTSGNLGGIVGIDPNSSLDDGDAEQDELYDQAVEFVMQTRRVSISSIQRRFKIGYNRSARIVEAMEAAGLVGPMQANGARELLVPPAD